MNGLSPDALKHSLAFKGQSARLFSDAVEQVRLLSEAGRGIYPPIQFPIPPDGVAESTLRVTPDSDFNGYLLPAEAVAVSILLDECGALAQAWGRTFERSNKLHAALQLSPHGSDYDAISGFAEFGDTLAAASAVRERLENKLGEPDGTTIKDNMERKLWRRFSDSLGKDNLGLGLATSEAVISSIADLANQNIPNNPCGARTPDEIKSKIESRIHGARLAKNLYLEALGLAAQVFSRNES